MCCSFENISYFGLKFLQYTLNIHIILSKYEEKNIDFLKPEHKTTSLIYKKKNL